MILYQVLDPLSNTLFTLPRRVIVLTAPQARRAALSTARGLHGVMDSNAGFEDDMQATEVTYKFRYFPREERKTADTLKRAFSAAVDHGLPQTLYFRDDDGNIWYAVGAKSISYPANVDVSTPRWFDITRTWRLNNPYLRLSRQTGELLWGDVHADGTPVLWGEAGLKWGQNPNVFTSTAASFDVTLVNTLGSVLTADLAIQLQVPASSTYGTTTVGTRFDADPNGIRIVNNDLPLGPNGSPMEMRICDALIAQDSVTIALANHAAVKNSVGIWGKLWRPPGQRMMMALKPGTNRLTISLRGTPTASLSVSGVITWYPRTLLM